MSETVNIIGAGIALEHRGLRDQVYELVLGRLTSSGLEPGSRLSIDALAADLNVSPTPVREALVSLERTGLVTREAHKGYRVAPPLSGHQLEALFDARIVLEGGTTELAATDPLALVPLLEDAVAKHREVTLRVKGSAASGELSVELLRGYFTIDWSFHRIIFEATQNPFLLDMSEVISTRVHRMRQTIQTGVSDAEEALLEHLSVLEAFKAGDPHLAGDAMRNHIEKTRTRSRLDARMS